MVSKQRTVICRAEVFLRGAREFCDGYAVFRSGAFVHFCVFAAILFVLFGKIILEVAFGRLFNADHFKQDARRIMLLQAIERFKSNPLVGSGLLDRTLEYEIIRKKGALAWYHMMIPQIGGSTGLVGVAAYEFMFYLRFRLIFRKPNGKSAVLGISYLGIFLMSQVNPGEFCPLPFGLLAVLPFVLQERRLEKA